MVTLRNITNLLILLIAVVVTLIYGQHLLIPIVFAVLLWVLMRGLNSVLEKVPFIKSKFPFWLKTIITSVIILGFIAISSKVLSSSISTLSGSYKSYYPNVENLTQIIDNKYDIDLVSYLKNYVSRFDFGLVLSVIFNSITDLVGNTFIVLIYTLFIFLEATNFQEKLRMVFESDSSYTKTTAVLAKIEDSVTHYLGLKTLVSIITGLLSYAVLFLIGIDSPAFWAFLIFLLNFIPTVGSLFATLFPAIFCIFQFGSFIPSIYTLVFVGAIQVVVGNILEPKLMGNSLNVSSLIAILSLSFWGSIWGIAGMILSIPITVIMIIICSQFEKTRPIAVMLSEKGKI